MRTSDNPFIRATRALERALPALIIVSAVFTLTAVALITLLSDSLLHVTLLGFSTALLMVGAFHLARKWSVFAALEARETSLFAVGALVLFIAPLRVSGSFTAPGDLGAGSILPWMVVGVSFVAVASTLMARKAGFFGPWLIGMALLTGVVWHNGLTTAVQYSFRDVTYLSISLAFIIIGAFLHIYSQLLRRQVSSAIWFRANGEPGKALRIYDAALRLNPGDEVMWNNRANVLADLGRYTESVKSYQRALNINPLYTVARTNMKQVRRMARLRNSRDKGAPSGSRERFIYLWRRKVYYQWAAVFALLFGAMFALQTYVELPGRMVLLGAEIQPQLVLDATIVLVMFVFSLNRTVRTLIYRGTLARLDGDYLRALHLYDIALKLNPFNDVAWNNRGNVLTSMGKYDEALASYDEALRLFPEQPAASKNRSILHRWNIRGRFNPWAIKAAIRKRLHIPGRRHH